MFRPGDHNFFILYIFLSKFWQKTKKLVGKFSFYTILKFLPWTWWLLEYSIFIVQLCWFITSLRVELQSPDWSHFKDLKQLFAMRPIWLSQLCLKLGALEVQLKNQGWESISILVASAKEGVKKRKIDR